MNKSLILFFLLISQHIYAQNLELSGKVDSYLLKPAGGKIYYAAEGQKFSPAIFILYDKNKKYKFKMPIAKIKQQKINVLAFATDITQKTGVNEEQSCVAKINIGEIIKAPEFSTLKTISLKTDLLIEGNCKDTTVSRLDKDLEKFLGDYEFELNDTLRRIKLTSFIQKYNSSFSKMTKDYMTEEWGYWDFDKDKQFLTLSVYCQTNQKYGLTILRNTKLEFLVKETPNGLTFESKIGVLRRK